MATIHGVRSFAGLRDRATTVDVRGVAVLVASLDDIIRSKRAARSRKKQLAAVARESDRALRELIRRWQALPMEKRTHFLRKRIGPGRTAL